MAGRKKKTGQKNVVVGCRNSESSLLSTVSYFYCRFNALKMI